ncbi:MAG: CBS domain-containing protein [Thermoproteota archaeon]|nr:CBS domain-containing protein [Thermoproteota archaeon]
MSASTTSSAPEASAYVEDIMSKDIVKIAADKSIQDVAIIMAERNISSILLEDSGKIIGILTERDLVRNVCAKDLLASKTPAVSIMSAPLATVSRSSLVERAADLMVRNKIRHLPVEDNDGNIIGVITTTDLARYLRRKLASTDPEILAAIYAFDEPYGTAL